jgi:hypothetical protein
MSSYGSELCTNDFSVKKKWFLAQGTPNPRRMYMTTTGDAPAIQIDLGGSGGTGQTQNDNGCCALVDLIAPTTTPVSLQTVVITHTGIPHDRCLIESNFIANDSDSANIKSGVIDNGASAGTFTFYRSDSDNFTTNAKVQLQLNTFFP